MRKIAIVGSHPDTSHNAPFQDETFEIWAMNTSAMTFPRCDVAFQMHTRPGFECKGERYMEWLRTRPLVWMRHKFQDIPGAKRYPFKKVFDLTQNVLQGQAQLEELHFFTSSMSYMLALAILQEVQELSIYGFGLQVPGEYREQLGGVTFWLGIAAGRGMKIEIHCMDWLFQRPLYGG
jgi:hypothetical protein